MGTVANLAVRIGVNAQDFQKGISGLQTSVDGMASRFAAVGTAIAGAFSINAIGAAAAQAIETASRIADMADRVGISAEAVQRLQFAATQSGGSFEAVVTSIGLMADKLGNGTTRTKDALAALGLTIEQVKAMAPDQAFLTIASAIASLEDPMMRLDVGRELMGRGFQQLLPAMVAGFADVAASAPVMSNAMIAAADQTGDKWAEMQLRINNLRAEALLPLLGTFLELPQSLQVATAGILSFLPSLSSIGIAVLAAGGPTAAMAALKGAFASILPYLGPAGLIAAGVIAAVAIWKNWDAISAIAQRVYTAVKTWLVDKFNAVVASIKSKVEAVTGFFRDMYIAVVGQSYVPDMVSRIGQEFGSLDRLMVGPTRMAVQAIDGLFGGLSQSVDGYLKGIMGSLGGFGKVLGSMLPSISGLITGGIGALVGAGIGWVGGKIANLFSGGEEAKSVNPARDQFLSQFGGAGTGAGSGFQNLAARLTELTGEYGGGQLFTALKQADTMQEFNAATSAIQSLLARNMQPAGGITVAVGTVETADADSFLTQDLVDAVRRNEHGVRTELTNLLAPREGVFAAY